MSATRSALQIEASRRNGARSRGPETAGGKARSARNATRHALTSRTIVLVQEEDRAAYAALRADLLARHRPEGALEEHWLQCLCDALWRRFRLDLLEARVLEALLAGEEGAGLPSLSTLARYRARIARDIREAEARLGELREARIHDVARATARDPARLRTLAAILERRRADRPGATPAEDGTNEPDTASRGASPSASPSSRRPAEPTPKNSGQHPACRPAGATGPSARARTNSPAWPGEGSRRRAAAAAEDYAARRGTNEPGTAGPEPCGRGSEAIACD